MQRRERGNDRRRSIHATQSLTEDIDSTGPSKNQKKKKKNFMLVLKALSAGRPARNLARAVKRVR